ncbi:MAG: DUF3267 domain-containing protein [Solobacterium sp.]|nr:DUF3267 domain-containing protein [Solobacterium sp.]
MDKQKKDAKTVDQERMKAFQEMSSGLRKQGYRQFSMAVGNERANRFSLTLAVPVCGLGLVLYMLLSPQAGIGFRSLKDSLMFLVYIILMLSAKELIRAVVWIIFGHIDYKAIEFGIMKDTFAPSVNCLVPIPKKAYMAGNILAVVLAAIVPFIIGITCGSFSLMLAAALLIMMSAGDFLLLFALIKHRSSRKDQMICDMPGQSGCMLFEK